MPRYQFVFDARLGISLPWLETDWEQYDVRERSDMLLKWEMIRGRIPDRIRELEEGINRKQEALYEEEDFETSCRLNSEIAEMASTIHDLQIWYRVQQTIHPRPSHPS